MMALKRPLYSQSLRVIGQSLDVVRPGGFQLTHEGDSFVVRTSPNDSAGGGSFTKSILKKLWGSPSNESESPLRFDLEAVSRLEIRHRGKRGESVSMPDPQTIAQALRVVGDYLDHKQPRAFTVDWNPGSVSVCYEAKNGSNNRETFSVSDLYDLAVHMYLHRSDRGS
jgi:hypothetical protein